jgi:beta-galactosidase
MRYGQVTAVAKPQGYPVFSPEVYTGWFATFGTWGRDKSPKVAVDRQVAQAQFLFDHKDVSWCLYLFNGGTNFGFTAGANNNHPMQTSYDYDSPIDELGRVTPKYLALREVYAKGRGIELPPVPADPKVIEVPKFTLSEQAPLLSRLPAKPVEGDNVLSMEDLDQNFGFVDYQKTFPDGLKGKLTLGQPRDYISVMINGKVVGESFNGFALGRNDPGYSLTVNQDGPCTLDVLVHNLGRNSLVTSEAGQRKGLTANPTLEGTALTGWKMYSMPMDDADQLPSAPAAAATAPTTGPTFYSGTFNLSDLGETYLDMSNWKFGVVWVNGHNLGRYWNVGTSRAIYLPSVWQKSGANQITVLELGPAPATPEIVGVTKMVETPALKVTPLWVKN